MDGGQLVDRRTLLQTNATITAGMLIFLTIGQVFTDIYTRDTTFIFTVIGFACLFASMIFCFVPSNKHIPFPKKKSLRVFVGAEISFLFGVLFLFGTVVMVLLANLY